MAEPLAYLNGQILPFSELSISVADAGFVFGATVSEYVRTFGGRLFRLDDHLERLRQSCELCRIPLTVSDEDLRSAAERLVEMNAPSPTLPQSRERGADIPSPNPSPKWGGEQVFLPSPPASGGEGLGVRGELALILFATPGPLPHLGGPEWSRLARRDDSSRGARRVQTDGGPTIAMHTIPLPFARYRRLFTEGARLVVPSIRRDSAIDPRAKMRSRMNWWIAEQEAHDVDPHAWALLLDADGYVTETAAANFLIARKGMVISPEWNCILNGVSLQVVKELCDELRIPFVEQQIRLNECLAADEAMLTGTAFCICGVSAINGVTIPWRGPLFNRIAYRWAETYGLNFIGQFVS